MAIARSTGTFAPAMSTAPSIDRSGVQHSGGRTLYKIDLAYHKIDEVEHIKWCRRNLGERNSTWDFWLAGGMLYIEIWGDKAKFTYEMWKN